MGIPRLYKYVNDNFPNSIQNSKVTFTPNNKFNVDNIISVDNLFIDANAILHECAQKVFNYGSHKRLLSKSNLNYDEKILKLYNLFFEKIKVLFTIANPSNLLYIAIDGPLQILISM